MRPPPGRDLAERMLPALRIVERAAKTALDAQKRWGLVERILSAALAYDGTECLAETTRQVTLREIAGPLAQVIEKLEHEANIDAVLISLGAPLMLMISPDQEAVHQAIAEHQAVLRSLHKIADNLPPAPEERGPGQPRARDLYELVGRLAEIWTTFTGKDFKREWQNGEPVTDAMVFVYAVVKIVDESRLQSLPTVTKNIVAELRKATPRK